jgi:hypothetical protein
MKKIPNRNRAALMRSIQILISSSHLRSIQLDAVAPGGKSFLVDTAVFLFTSEKADYVAAIRQSSLISPLELKLLRRTRDGILHAFTCLGLDTVPHQERAGKPRQIKPIHDVIDQLCGEQLDLFTVEEDAAEFAKLHRLANKIGTAEAPLSFVNGVVDIDALDKTSNRDTTKIDIFYKSENTTIRHLPFKILMFTVANKSGRHDVYTASFQRPKADRDFGTAMAHFKYGRHGRFMSHISALARATSSGVVLQRLESQQSQAVICLTQPKDEEGNVDQHFTPLQSYVLNSVDESISSNVYLTMSNDAGREVSRKAQHFIMVPRFRAAA